MSLNPLEINSPAVSPFQGLSPKKAACVFAAVCVGTVCIWLSASKQLIGIIETIRRKEKKILDEEQSEDIKRHGSITFTSSCYAGHTTNLALEKFVQEVGQELLLAGCKTFQKTNVPKVEFKIDYTNHSLNASCSDNIISITYDYVISLLSNRNSFSEKEKIAPTLAHEIGHLLDTHSSKTVDKWINAACKIFRSCDKVFAKSNTTERLKKMRRQIYIEAASHIFNKSMKLFHHSQEYDADMASFLILKQAGYDAEKCVLSDSLNRVNIFPPQTLQESHTHPSWSSRLARMAMLVSVDRHSMPGTNS